MVGWIRHGWIWDHVQSHLKSLSRQFLVNSRKSLLSRLCQRAENGGLDPSWFDFAVLGRPDFQSRRPKMLLLKGF